MTSYASEEDFLLDQIRSNKLAIKYLQGRLTEVIEEFFDDHAYTKKKIINAYTEGIEVLKIDSEEKQKRLELLALKRSEREDG